MEEKIYQCICGKSFDNAHQLAAHQSICKVYRLSKNLDVDYICKICGKHLGSASALSSHINKVHLGKQYKEKPKTACPICGKLINNNCLARHIDSHFNHPEYQAKQNIGGLIYKLDHDDLFCKFCGKECKNKNSLVQHEIRCKLNPTRLISKVEPDLTKIYKCQYCEKEFNSLAVCKSHEKRCIKNPDGLKNLDAQIQKSRETYSKNFKAGLHKSNSHPHSEETKRKIGESVSKALREGFASGRLAPNKGIGRGKGSYIHIGEKEYFCRSTYEFIYALYLFYIENKVFTLEEITVPASRQNKYGDSFLCDFYIKEENLIIETKGIPSDKDILLKESFESAGYNFVELFSKEINECRKELIQFGIKIDELIQQIKDGAKNKEFFHYTLA